MRIIKRYGFLAVILLLLVFQPARFVRAATYAPTACQSLELGEDMALSAAAIFTFFGPAGVAAAAAVIVSTYGVDFVYRETGACD
jgi:NhaP-type Na+/H+ or K+/H+ antiporter